MKEKNPASKKPDALRNGRRDSVIQNNIFKTGDLRELPVFVFAVIAWHMQFKNFVEYGIIKLLKGLLSSLSKLYESWN